MNSKSSYACQRSDRRPRPWFLFCILAVSCFTALSASAEQPTYDFIISGARIVDGTGAAWHYGDLAIKGDRIAAVGDLHNASANQRIDARGLVVSPGFIDVQGQSEFNILVDGAQPAKSRRV
jgi:N-acyl-D-amino-acid deacylase